MTATILPGDSRYLALMSEDLHDPLTGLPNAAQFRSRLASIASGQVALLFLDLDGFRAVSNGLGAEVADQVLRGVASTLREVFGVVVASGAYLPEHITREDAQIWVGRASPMG